MARAWALRNREPVLKLHVRHWLMQREEILAFVQARPVDGGGGAVMVLLKSNTQRLRLSPIYSIEIYF
jgi:DNA-nicking Smr family endonuclease